MVDLQLFASACDGSCCVLYHKIMIPFFFHFLEHSWLQNAKKASNVPLGDIVRARLKQFSVMNRFKKKAMRVSIRYG